MRLPEPIHSISSLIDQYHSEFYVYAHCKPETGEIYYIGKGKGKRAYDFKRRNEHWHRVAKKYGVEVLIIADGLTEKQALELEKNKIADIGLDKLCNQTEGGRGLSGHKFSAEHRAKIGAAHKGRAKPKHVMEALAKANIGRNFSDERRKKLSAAHKGRKKSPEHIAKVAAGRIGKSHTPQGKHNIRVAKCKIVICIETGVRFFGTKHAAEWLHIKNPKACSSAIARSCAKPGKIAYGYTWRYE